MPLKAIAELLSDAAPAIVHELEILIRLVFASDSPEQAITKAQKAILADAADLATDTALRGLLKR